MRKAILYLLLVSSNTWAGNIDLSIDINPSTISDFSIGDVGEFSITITNNGPDDAGLNFPVSIDSERIYIENNGSFVDFVANPNILNNCPLYQYIIDPRPGDLASIIYTFSISTIPAESSITCYGLYYINFEEGVRTVEWSSFSVSDTDTESTNDLALMKFINPATPVPSLSIYNLIFLALIMMIFAYRFNTKP